MIKSTREQLINFKESFVWNDIRSELRKWIVGLREDSLRLARLCATEEVPRDIAAKLAAIGGRIEAIEYFLHLPDELIARLELQNAERNKTR